MSREGSRTRVSPLVVRKATESRLREESILRMKTGKMASRKRKDGGRRQPEIEMTEEEGSQKMKRRRKKAYRN